MRIAVNTRLLLKDKLDGIGWFTYETLKRITQNNPEHEFIFLFDRKFDDEFIFSSNIQPVVIAPQARHPVLWYLWLEYSVKHALKKFRADIFLSPDGFIPLKSDIPSVAVIHDINFVHHSEDIPLLTRWYYLHYFPLFAQKSVRIATVSEYSKDDICSSYQIAPEKIDVVYNGANEIYTPLDERTIAQTKQKYTAGNEYFIFIGSLLPRKNIVRLLQAFDRFKNLILDTNLEGIKLVIVGKPMFMTNDIWQTYNTMECKADVIFTGRLDAPELHRVLGAATAMTFIPYFEGFGIPIIEAMNCDVPVMTSDITSMPEVSGDAALLVNPFSIDSIVAGMLKITTDTALRKNLIAKEQINKLRFSWDATAEKLWNCILEAQKAASTENER